MRSRHNARKCVIQALYQLDALGDSKGESIKEFEEVYLDKDKKREDKNYYKFFRSLLEGVLKNVSFLDEKIVSYSSRQRVNSLGRVERSILRVGAYELIFTKDTPKAVIIDEAVRLAKEFATEEAAIFVNGVLDKLGRECREET
ncbi:MAG: transcription antitermination factor NusB [Candidatus Dadabacteria bacterium]|nr:MAG: transcription antitermination factor NusB [Candidatus Dadabacteria bacterium]